MMPNEIRMMPHGGKVLLTSGKYKAKTFKKESDTIWVQLWTWKATPRPHEWMPVRITSLDVIAGRPEVVH